jgi:hypothetical protein
VDRVPDPQIDRAAGAGGKNAKRTIATRFLQRGYNGDPARHVARSVPFHSRRATFFQTDFRRFSITSQFSFNQSQAVSSRPVFHSQSI